MKLSRSSRLSLMVVVGAQAFFIWSVMGFMQGCAARSTSPEAIAARTGTVLELILVAQRAIIAAEEADLIDEATTRMAVIRIGQAAQHALDLRPILESWDRLSDADHDRARAIVFTLSQVLAAIMASGDEMAPIQDALLGANGLLLAIDDLR